MRKTLLTMTALTAIVGATSLATTAPAQAMPVAPIALASTTVDPALVQPAQYHRDWHRGHHWRHRPYGHRHY